MIMVKASGEDTEESKTVVDRIYEIGADFCDNNEYACIIRRQMASQQ